VVFEGGNYFRNPALLEFAAENPDSPGTLPANIVSVAKVILEAGAPTDQSALTRRSGWSVPAAFHASAACSCR